MTRKKRAFSAGTESSCKVVINARLLSLVLVGLGGGVCSFESPSFTVLPRNTRLELK